MKPCLWRALAVCAGATFLVASARAARAGAPIVLQLDASKAPTQNVVFTRETIPVQPGNVVTFADVYRTIDLSYFDGPRYPHLMRIDGVPDRLSEVVKPRS